MLLSQAFSLICPLYVIILASHNYDDFVFSANILSISIAGALFILNDLGLYQLIIKKISDTRNDKKLINQLISLIYCQRFMMVVISLLIVIFISEIGNYEKIQKYLFIVLVGIVSQAFQPIWFFQALENVKFYCLVNIFSKIVNASLVTYLIFNDQNSYALVIGFAISNLLMFFLLNIFLINSGFKFNFVKIKKVIDLIWEGKSYFFSRITTLTYSGLISFLVGINDFKSAGVIALAEQLHKAIQLSISPVIQVLIPYCNRVRDSRVVFKILFGLIAVILLLTFLVDSFGLWMASNLWNITSRGELLILMVYFFSACINTVTSLIGFPLFAAIGFYSKTNISSIINGLISISILFIFFYYLNQFLMFVVLICELTFLIVRIVHLSYINKRYL